MLSNAAVAWDLPATRAAHAAYRQGALRWLLGGVGGVGVAVALSAYAVLILRRPGLGVVIIAALLLGIVGLVTGAGGLFRAGQFQAVLQRAPWQDAELRLVGATMRLVFDDVSEAGSNGAEPSQFVDARMLSTSRWRMREVVGYSNGQVRVCAGPNLYVLASLRMNTVYGLRPLTASADQTRA